MNKASLAGAMTLVLLAAIVAGCGGGDDTGGEETVVVLSKAEFIKQGDEICAETNDQSEEEAKEFAEENDFTLEKASEAQLEEAVAEVLVPALERQADDLNALGAPEGDEEQVEEITTALEDATAEIEDDPSLVFEEDTLAEPSRLAEAYGFKVCGAE